MKLINIKSLAVGQSVQFADGRIVQVLEQDTTAIPTTMVTAEIPEMDLSTTNILITASTGRTRLLFTDGTVGILNWEDARAIDPV